jgi:hypothetical protein
VTLPRRNLLKSLAFACLPTWAAKRAIADPIPPLPMVEIDGLRFSVITRVGFGEWINLDGLPMGKGATPPLDRIYGQFTVSGVVDLSAHTVASAMAILRRPTVTLVLRSPVVPGERIIADARPRVQRWTGEAGELSNLECVFGACDYRIFGQS